MNLSYDAWISVLLGKKSAHFLSVSGFFNVQVLGEVEQAMFHFFTQPKDKNRIWSIILLSCFRKGLVKIDF